MTTIRVFKVDCPDEDAVAALLVMVERLASWIADHGGWEYGFNPQEMYQLVADAGIMLDDPNLIGAAKVSGYELKGERDEPS